MEIDEIFQEFHNRFIGQEKFYSEIGTAVDVDEEKRTCNFQPTGDEGKRHNIRLQSVISESKGFVLIPKENSKIAVSFLNRTTGFVSLTSELKKVIWDVDLTQINGGDNGGLVNINDMVTEYNKTKALIQAWITIITGAPIPETGNGASSSLQTAMSTAIATLELGSFDNLEDTKVTH